MEFVLMTFVLICIDGDLISVTLVDKHDNKEKLYKY